MNEARAQQLIVGCMAASAAVAVGSTIAEGEGVSTRQVVGFGFVTLGLATGAMFAPALAGSFAALVLTSTVFLYGLPLYEAVTTATSSTSSTSSTAPARTPRKVYA